MSSDFPDHSVDRRTDGIGSASLAASHDLAQSVPRLSGGIVRATDLFLATILLIVLVPVLATIAIAILMADGSPIIFSQERSGRNEGLFRILKFRTLRLGDDGVTRPFRFGQFLRTTSLDELPQLINVVRGEMSFVGPRPLLPEYAPYYSDLERMRFLVRPGVTGLAQISGRHEITWDEKLATDVAFVKRYSVWTYFRILASTPIAVLTRRGTASSWNQEVRLDVERRGNDHPATAGSSNENVVPD
ncbi:MAG: sugar transferase [Rhodothermales bacterium]|nr:sugar transferase [Rhodothermales bacterium]